MKFYFWATSSPWQPFFRLPTCKTHCRLLCRVMLHRLIDCNVTKRHDSILSLLIRYSVCLCSLKYSKPFGQLGRKYCPTPRLSLISVFNDISKVAICCIIDSQAAGRYIFNTAHCFKQKLFEFILQLLQQPLYTQ